MQPLRSVSLEEHYFMAKKKDSYVLRALPLSVNFSHFSLKYSLMCLRVTNGLYILTQKRRAASIFHGLICHAPQEVANSSSPHLHTHTL